MHKNNDSRIGTQEAVRKLGVSFERLRYWEVRGIVRPTYAKCGTRRFRRYSREDIRRASLVKFLVDSKKYSLEGALIQLVQDSKGHP